ncbi:hypothetical protein OG223_41045 [Streptomyces sp. NBC_01478]|uniref:hypothetical protein n=1 Tax=Streptomyces sp. NBC_01478 TaxID=2903882 RepID=UPI002E32759E|nr:hypothetical protein [Streptomyces sp. NBC_01478]
MVDELQDGCPEFGVAGDQHPDGYEQKDRQEASARRAGVAAPGSRLRGPHPVLRGLSRRLLGASPCGLL